MNNENYDDLTYIFSLFLTCNRDIYTFLFLFSAHRVHTPITFPHPFSEVSRMHVRFDRDVINFISFM